MKVKPTETELFGVLHRFNKSNECMKFLSGRVRAHLGICSFVVRVEYVECIKRVHGMSCYEICSQERESNERIKCLCCTP
jgi:hypothetical protein